MECCILCKSSEKDDVQYGDMLVKKKICVHTFCLYLSSNLAQNGEEKEGLLGFLEADIRNEVKRISFLKCCYCHKRYANIGCGERKCRRSFHLICGIKHNAENQFCGSFPSFCHQHVTKVDRCPANESCLICYENLCTAAKSVEKNNVILAPCCRNGWFHKLCLQRFAKTAGYFFKCPLCNDFKTFRKNLPIRGIFIPNRDAAWELEDNAFNELLQRPNECSAQQCKNKLGRKNSSKSPFVVCRTCGSTAIHKLCLPKKNTQFQCADCTDTLKKVGSGMKTVNLYEKYDNEDDSIDVCNVSDKEDMAIINWLNTSSSQESLHSTTDRSDEIPCTSRRRNKSRIIESSSDSESDDINPNIANRKKYFRIDSEDSDCSYISRTQIRRRRALRLKISSDTEENTSTSEEDEIRRPYVKKNRLIYDCERSDLNRLTVPESRRVTSSDFLCTSNSDEQAEEKKECLHFNVQSNKNTCMEPVTSNSDLYNTVSPPKNEYMNSSTTTEVINILNDSEDKELKSSKEKSLDCENVNNESDGEDPIENIFEYIIRKKKSGCAELDKTKNFNVNDLPRLTHSSPSKEYDLNTSCIAKRTRRKTVSNSTNNSQEDQQQKKNFSDISCVAVRTRRNTFCAHTFYNTDSLLETSQVYEKVHHSNENIAVSMNDDNSEVPSKLMRGSVDNDSNDSLLKERYEKDSNLDISYIANRTRNRKSLKSKYNHLPKVFENKISTAASRLQYGITLRRRSNRRISSNFAVS